MKPSVVREIRVWYNTIASINGYQWTQDARPVVMEFGTYKLRLT